MTKRTKWEKKEIRTLEWYIGTKPLHSIAELLDRTLEAVKAKAKRLGAKATKGHHTFRAVMRETGFNQHQLTKARDTLKQRWKRANTSRGAYTITDEQLADILAYLCQPPKFITQSGNQTDKWAKTVGIDKCVKCGVSGNDKYDQYKSNGLCYRCFNKLINNKYMLNRYKLMARYLKILSQLEIEFVGQDHPVDQITEWGKKVIIFMAVICSTENMIIISLY